MRRLGLGAKLLLAAGALAASLLYARDCVRRGNDFRTMWTAWNYVLDGTELYRKVEAPDATPAHWRNPPFFTLATSPFGLLPQELSGYAWFYFKLGLVFWCAAGLARLARRLGAGAPGAVAGPVLLAACWFNNDLTIGHMNLVTSALVVQGLLAFLEGRDRSAALWSSLAVCVKGNAALLPLFFAARRRFRLAAATVLLCAAWSALPALRWGPSEAWRYTREFAASARFEVIFSDVDNGWAENWGVQELVMRSLGQAHPANRYGTALELARVPFETAARAAKGAAALLLLGLLWLWSRGEGGLARGLRSPDLHHAALAATATLLLSPVTRKAYFGSLLLPYFLLWVVWRHGLRTPARARASGLFAASLVLSSLTHVDLVGRPLAFRFETWHFLSFSLLALAGSQLGLALDALRPRPAAPAGAPR